MKIAYIINSLEGGGAALPLPDIIRTLQKRGHEVTVFALMRRDGRALEPLLKRNIPVQIRPGGMKDHVSALIWLMSAVKLSKPDLIWTSLTRATLLGQIVGFLLSRPVVSWQHSAHLRPANARLLRLMRRLTKLWIADSRCVEEETIRKLSLGRNQLMRWPIFKAREITGTAAPWKKGEVLRIGSVGRLHPVKGYDTLCAAVLLLTKMRDLPPFEVHIAGIGAERQALEQLIARNNLPIVLHGYCENSFEFLRRLHLYVQPSHWEGLCLAAHEALLCGLPIVASRAGEIPYTVLPEFGRIVPPKNPEALARALRSLLVQADSLDEMGKLARSRVLERFSAVQFDQQGERLLARLEGFV